MTRQHVAAGFILCALVVSLGFASQEDEKDRQEAAKLRPPAVDQKLYDEIAEAVIVTDYKRLKAKYISYEDLKAEFIEKESAQ